MGTPIPAMAAGFTKTVFVKPGSAMADTQIFLCLCRLIHGGSGPWDKALCCVVSRGPPGPSWTA